MKSSKIKIGVMIAVVALGSVPNIFAAENAGSASYLSVLTTTASAELPAKAAELVAQADSKNLKQTTMDVVKAAVGLNPAAAPAIVGSIGQTSPAMVATAAATAVALVPSQLSAIARAAAAAAPARAGSIVEAICRVMPAAYQTVAAAVSEVVPGAGKAILSGIAIAIPQLKDAINQTISSYGGRIPSVSEVLAQVAQTENSPGAPAPSLVVSHIGSVPPQVPISATPPVVNPASGSPAPPGGLNYSAP